MSRSSLCRRPLFVLCAVFFLSSLFFARVNGMTIILTSLVSALALAGCGVLFVCKRSTVRIVPVLICAAVILSGVFTYFTVTSKIRDTDSLDGATADGRVTVLSVEYTSEYLSAYTVRLDGLDGYSGKISLSLEDRSLSRGDVLDGKFKLSVPAKDDKSEYYKSGIFLLAQAEEVSFVESRSKFSVSGFFDELNEKLCRVLKGNGDQGELASAILLGDRDGLDTAVKRDFSRLGIYHLLALSGLHLS
ncbi:MAG: ComEC/Rec2 family competence protein, partial [Clostridia bacterium]|nr:ComEC/Rec2 family competence protein [Clostridia bacterium]